MATSKSPKNRKKINRIKEHQSKKNGGKKKIVGGEFVPSNIWPYINEVNDLNMQEDDVNNYKKLLEIIKNIPENERINFLNGHKKNPFLLPFNRQLQVLPELFKMPRNALAKNRNFNKMACGEITSLWICPPYLNLTRHFVSQWQSPYRLVLVRKFLENFSKISVLKMQDFYFCF